MRILVTGSRDWDDKQMIFDVLWAFTYGRGYDFSPYTLVSGHCPSGADALAESLAAAWEWDIELHPADWETYGKRAGFIRNQEMVDSGADICLAFRRGNSKGTTHCGEAAEKAGITTVWVEDDSPLEPKPTPRKVTGL
jgi:hypothetical protein